MTKLPIRGASAALLGLSMVLLLSVPPVVGETPGIGSIDVGEWVEASVVPDGEERWITSELDVKAKGAPNTGSLTGPYHRDAAGAITVLGVPVWIIPATTVKDTAGDNVSIDSLVPGTLVEARVVREGDRFTATKLRARPAGKDWEIEGPVEALAVAGSPTLRIMGFEIAVSESVMIRSVDKRPRFIRLADDDDLLPASRVGVGPLLIGGTATVAGRREDNLDLNRSKAENIADSDLTGRLEASGKLSERVQVYGKGSYRRRVILEDQRGTKIGFGRSEMEQAYLLLLGLGRPEIALQVGRQQFDESREWVYRKNLDAVRLHWIGDRVWSDLSLSTRLDELDPSLSATWNAIASLETKVHPAVSTGAYLVRRGHKKDRGEGALTWTGLRLVSLKTHRFRGWGEASLLRGEESGLRVRGTGFHVSGSALLAERGRVMLNAAWARGSGDVDLTDGVDGNFRQTGLHRDNDRFGGVTSFRYYGELFRPGLSNVTIATAGIGIRPLAATSCDLVFHRYRQVEAAPFLLESDLEIEPSGIDPDLGHEIDLVIGIRSIRNVRIEYTLSGFWAGKAFQDQTERALSSRLQVDLGV